MSGGSQHNPNGRQPQLGAGWSPLQLQVASFLARAPQAHMASERGVTWHTPTPPPHLYHVPAPSPPDPLQAMKAGGNSVFRHTATPPELYRHTPTPPDKHLMRHTPSPGDVKAGTALPPAELYPHLGPTRDKLVRPEELLSYARGGVDLSLGGARGANGAAGSPAPPHAPHPAHAAHPAHPSPALSVRDAPTINSLIARAQPRHPHARVDALLERLVPSPVSPHSVIMHSRAAPTPSPPSSNEDSADSCGAPPGSKRKRKPERTIRVSAPPPPASSDPPRAAPTPPAHSSPREPQPVENGDATHDTQNEPDKIKCEDLKPEKPPSPPPQQAPEPHARRKSRSASAETIDDIAAMIASADQTPTEPDKPAELEIVTPVTIDKLKSVLTSPDSKLNKSEDVKKSPPKEDKEKDVSSETPVEETAAAPKRRSTRTSNSESTNVPVASPSEAKPAEPEASEVRSTEPTASSFVEVENQLEKMFAGLEEEPSKGREGKKTEKPNKAKKRRKSAPTKGESKAARRASRASLGEERRKGARKKGKKDGTLKDAYDSGSNASSSRSRGPYIQIRGPRDSPLSVSVINASTGDDDGEASTSRRKGGEEFRNGLRARGLHASTLGLRYDATTPDATWLCAFCERGPHAAVLGDLFGPYTVETDCDEYRILDEATRRRYESATTPNEVWFHEACAVWAPGLVAAGARLWGLAGAVWAARGARCCACGKAGAGVACAERGCRARVHVPCAPAAQWTLNEEQFRGVCARHA